MQKLIIANWKEHPATEKEAMVLFGAVAKSIGKDSANKKGAADIVICPPFIYIEEIAKAFAKLGAGAKANQAKQHLALGAQDVFWEDEGAYTGEVGPKMISSLGLEYVIIGHSERRKWLDETDSMINKKIKLALQDGLRVVLCVGEPLGVRSKGPAAAKSFIKNQLKKDLAGVSKKMGGASSLIIAYEPIWAIGTGKNADPQYAADIARFIKKSLPSGTAALKPLVLYGGSVNSGNILDYVHYKEIDGALVGGASLKAGEFDKMVGLVNGARGVDNLKKVAKIGKN